MAVRIGKIQSILLVFLIGLLGASVAAWADERIDELPDEYRKWLEEIVVYIITDVERDTFLELSTRQERDRFIEAFWDRRDPDPTTLENEFQVEHYNRIEHANTVLGRDTTRPGWKTDRGKYWIMLGKPREIQNYDGYNEVVSSELWIYQGDTSLGLPARFNLLFYKDNDIGEYELYHPYSDGPNTLLRGGTAAMQYRVNQHRAVDLLEQVGVDLALASLTIDLTENMTYTMFAARNSIQPLEQQVRPAMNVDRTLMNIELSPTRIVDTSDLEGYKKFGHKVAADYSFKFFPSRSVFAVLYGPGNVPFLHYGLEIDPSDFTLETDEDGSRHYTTLEVDLEVRDLEGKPAAYNLNQPLVQLTASQFEAAKNFPIAYRDNYPLVPGDYKVSLVLKNRATKDYTATEFDVQVAAIEPGQPALGDLVLGYDRGDVTAADDVHRTFQIGATEIYPSAENVFTTGTTVQALLQTIGTEPGQLVRFRTVTAEQEAIHEETADAKEGVMIHQVPLLGVDSGYYELRADLLSSDGAVLASRTAPITVSPRSDILRPAFVYRHSFNTNVPGFLEMTIGNQHLAAGRVPEATEWLEKAVAKENPQLPMARWRLATIVLYGRNADRAIELLAPLEKDFPNEYEVVEGLGFAYYIKEDYARAKGYFEHSSTIRTPDTTALNALGDCYERLGETEKAKELYQRSLQLNPDQTGVKARLASLSGAE